MESMQRKNVENADALTCAGNPGGTGGQARIQHVELSAPKQ